MDSWRSNANPAFLAQEKHAGHVFMSIITHFRGCINSDAICNFMKKRGEDVELLVLFHKTGRGFPLQKETRGRILTPERIWSTMEKTCRGDGAGTAGQMREEPDVVEEKRTFRKKIVNFWYYYRHTIIVVLFFGVIALLFCKDFLFREKADMKILVATWDADIGQAQEEALRESLACYVPDLNGDGKRLLELSWVDLVDPDSVGGDAQAVTGMQTRLAGELSDYDTVLLIFDSQMEEDFDLDEACVNLPAQYPQLEAQGTGISLAQLGLLDDLRLENAKELGTLCLYLRQNFHSSDKKQEAYERQVQVVENILTGQTIE